MGDLGGYIAAGYLRGIDYIQVPTSVIAMCDSAIGGKTGINSKRGKNLIGAVYNPKAVMINTWFLRSLDQRNFNHGIVEVIKLAAIRDLELFEALERNEDITAIMAKSVQGKVKIVMVKNSLVVSIARPQGGEPQKDHELRTRSRPRHRGL